jgi:hypothetical protein
MERQHAGQAFSCLITEQSIGTAKWQLSEIFLSFLSENVY